MTTSGSETARDLHVQAMAAFQSGAVEAALSLMQQACADAAAPGIYYGAHAEMLRQCGRMAEAEDQARLAIVREPKNAQAWNTLGAILVQKGDLAQSRDCYARAVRIDPDFVKALNNLAVVLQRLGERGAAEARYRQVLALAPDNLNVQLNFAQLLRELGRYGEALAIVDGLLERAPGLTTALLLGSDIERDSGRDREALKRLEQALAIYPDQVEALVRRAHLFSRLEQWPAALTDADRALHLAPGHSDGLLMRAQALQGLDRADEALAAFSLAEQASAEPARVLTARAGLLAELGRRDEALAVYQQALALRPDLADAWYGRAALKRYTAGDTDLVAMEAIVDRTDAPARDRLQLGFVLGRAYLDIGDGDRAFARLRAAAAQKRAGLDYDVRSDARTFAGLRAAFCAEHLQARAGAGYRTAAPIFVFGMPRSGTSLVEQILASHPQVQGAGEPMHLAQIAQAPGVISRLADLQPEHFNAFGRGYMELLEGEATSSRRERVVDKSPANFQYAGLISLILPDAPMIHCRRDPLDTCLSCYSLLFSGGMDYSYDLGELGHYYRLYQRLMAHWRRALPPGRLLEFDYEALVAAPEVQIRRLLAHCGLPWDEACLRFYETPRRVVSASLNQVRSPIYSTSVGRAQRFRPWLGALEAALISTRFDGDLAAS